MTQEQIEAVRVRAIVVRNAAITFGGVEQIDLAKTVADDLDALATRLAEVERERDEARRLLSACGDESTACWNNLVKAGQQRDQARADLATLRAAVDEAVSELENLDETFDYAAFCRALDTLRKLTKPEAPSERIMSDKDRENPVEGAHPLTKPEGEDALVEALTEVWRNSDQHIGDEAWEVAWARDLRKALASRGLVVRGEGVER